MLEFDALSYQQQQCFLAHAIGVDPNRLNFQFTLDIWTFYLWKAKKIKRETKLKTMIVADI